MFKSLMMAAAAGGLALVAATTAQAQATGTPYEKEIGCTIMDGQSNCSATLKVPAGMVLTVTSISAYTYNTVSNTNVQLSFVYAEQREAVTFPNIITDGADYPGTTIMTNAFAEQGAGSEFTAMRSGTSGAEGVAVTVIGYLNGAPR